MSEDDEAMDPMLAAVGLAVEPVTPPAGLRDRILEAARARPIETGPVVELRRRPGGAFRMPLGALAAMVAFALLVGLLAGDRFGQANAPAGQQQVARFTLTGS